MTEQEYEELIARLVVLERQAQELVQSIHILVQDAVDNLHRHDVE